MIELNTHYHDSSDYLCNTVQIHRTFFEIIIHVSTGQRECVEALDEVFMSLKKMKSCLL